MSVIADAVDFFDEMEAFWNVSEIDSHQDVFRSVESGLDAFYVLERNFG